MNSYNSFLSFTQIKKLSETDFLAADTALRLLAERREQADDTVLDATVDEIEITAPAPAPAPAPAIEPALLAQIRAYRAKHPQADPQATEKIKVERYLKKNHRSSADLPEGFWNEPDRAARGYALSQVIGEVRAKERAAKRLERLISAGYPDDYYSRPRDEQRRISAAVRSRRRRAKSAPTRAAGLVRTIPAATITRDWCADKLARLKRWTEGTGPMARKLRGREHDLLKAAAHRHNFIAEFGREPSHGELAGRIRCTRHTARNRLRVLVSLYGVAGPWHSKA
jgi:hypothetical protein